MEKLTRTCKIPAVIINKLLLELRQVLSIILLLIYCVGRREAREARGLPGFRHVADVAPGVTLLDLLRCRFAAVSSERNVAEAGVSRFAG